MRRSLAVLITLAIAALGLSACGGSGGGDDATALIKDTFAADHPIRSGRVDATLDVDLQGLPTFTKPLSLHLSGPFQSNGGKTLPDFALDLDVQGGDQPVTVGATFAQGGGWLRLEGQAFDLGKDVTAAFRDGYLKAKADAAKRKGSQSALAALGIRPENWLKDPKKEGSEDIAGTETEHVSANVDVGRLLEDMSTVLARARSVTGQAAAQVPAQLTPQQRDEIERSVKSASIDVWTGKDDHALRRFALGVQLAVPKDLQASAGGLRGGHIALDLTIAQLNQRQTVTKPASSRPLSELRAALQQLGLLGSGSSSGSSGSSSSSSSSGASTTTTPSASDPQASYAQCLAQAGQDLAKVQKCAPLLK
jgi:hypothetical protein